VQTINAAWRAKHGGGGGMAGHWLTTSQWALPTAEHYAWLRNLVNAGKPGEFLRKDYEDLRRFFDMRTGDQKTDVWRFAPETERFGHPTVKPLPLISYIVRLSCRPGGTILDPFSGSCTTGRAAKDLGRRCVCIDREERYCEIGAKRMAQGVLDFSTAKPHTTKDDKTI
jgi:DNA modification methylase